MAVDFNNIRKTGRVETYGKSTQSAEPGSDKKAQNSNLFQTLLSMLEPKETSRPVSSLRNRPASSQIIKCDHRAAARNPGLIRGLCTPAVNNLAASSLIAMEAVSHAPNSIEGLYLPCEMPGLPDGDSSSARLSAPNIPAGPDPEREIGALSARFESGEKGPGVIGYDSNGGTSYGTYQISSRAGTMKLFIDYLSERAPDLAARLKAAGPADTGSRSGRMPEVWQEITAADPARFEKLQHDFIEKSHYLPALREISDRTGLDISKAPRALQEVLWSTAVQHGPKGAAGIFVKAIRSAEGKDDAVKMARLIGAVYDMRAGRFQSSGSDVRAAVRGRFKEEGEIALAMLSNPSLDPRSVRA